jgi:hypothetical protein
MRDGADFFSRSSSNRVTRKYPRWLIANVLSIPSSVIERSRNTTPALLTVIAQNLPVISIRSFISAPDRSPR